MAMKACCCCCCVPPPLLVVVAVLLTSSAGASRDGSWFRFTQASYNASIAENSPPRTYVTPARPGMGIYVGYDAASSGPALTVAYSLRRSRAVSRLFRPESRCAGDFCFLLVRTRSGAHAALNRERTPGYRVTVEATVRGRGGRQPLSARAELAIDVLDANDLSPLFDVAEYRAAVRDDAPLHASVARVAASDADVGPNGEVYYGLVSDTFAVHPTSGVVTLTRPLNAADQDAYELTVTARDRGPALQASCPAALPYLLFRSFCAIAAASICFSFLFFFALGVYATEREKNFKQQQFALFYYYCTS